MPDLDYRQRRYAAWAKLALTVALIAILGYLLAGFLSGAFDQVIPA